MFALYAGTDAADAADLMRLAVDEIANAAETISEAEIARAKAQMKAGLLMALESSGERVGQLARHMMAWGTAHSAQRVGREGRGGDGRECARRRARLDPPRQAGDRRARAWIGT